MAQTQWTAEQLQVIVPAEIILSEYRKTLLTTVGPYDQDVTPPAPQPRARPCARCGHQRNIHEHYRQGTDCASCGRAACWAYKQPGIIPATIRALRKFGAWWKRVTA